MAPSRRKTSRRTNPTRVIMTRSICKKQQQEEANTNKLKEEEAKSTSSNIIDEEEENETTTIRRSTSEDDVVCSTPRGRKYMIPKTSTCPPAPMKKRLVLNPQSRAAAKFFSHPELDVFFLFSPRNSGAHALDSNQARLF